MLALKNVILTSLRLSSYSKTTNNLVSLFEKRCVSSILPNPFSTSVPNSLIRQLPSNSTNTSILSSVSSLVPSLFLKKSCPSLQQTRSVTKWSLNKGKRKTVKAVVARFYRLGWGAWIRPMVGRNKHHWSKTAKRKIRAEKHVFCNSTQSTLLDKMVTKYWRKRRFYVDDLYEPYHQREEYSLTAVKPH
uniref:Large ribosomal subunit protein bL35m n=1 Tax=Daphnia sinensis TaxID=1820382 RepID=A0A4Y7N983_9CRUS|nr:EOG090X0J5E [Daphnia sinensis]